MVVIEQGEKSYGAYVPDLPGCVAAGESKEEAIKLIEEAIELHIKSLRRDGQSVPEPKTISEFIEVNAAWFAKCRVAHRHWERCPTQA